MNLRNLIKWLLQLYYILSNRCNYYLSLFLNSHESMSHLKIGEEILHGKKFVFN